MVIWSEISLMDWGINICLKSTVVLLLAFGLVRLLVNSTAKIRYTVWKGAFLVLLFLPFIGLLPSIHIAPANQDEHSFQTISELPIPYESVLQNTETDTKNISLQPSIKKESTLFERLNFLEVVFFIWAIGCSFFIMLILLEYYFLLKITRERRNKIPATWHSILQIAEQQMGAVIVPTIILSKHLNTPVAYCSLRKNYILMPMNALAWKAAQIKTVFLHELGHFCQKDLLTNILVQFVKAIYWWQPLIWIALAKIRLECECSCDELVLESGEPNLEYAQNLTDIAKSIFLAPTQLSKVALPVVNNSQLKERISTILKETNPSLGMPSWRILRLLIGLIIPLFCLNFKYTSHSIIQKNRLL